MFFAGISGRRPNGTIPGMRETSAGTVYDAAEQADAAFENLLAMLGEHDLDRTSVVDVTCYLVDMTDYPALVASWNRFFADDAPARTTIAVHQLPDPDLRVELKAVAYRPSNRSSGPE